METRDLYAVDLSQPSPDSTPSTPSISPITITPATLKEQLYTALLKRAMLAANQKQLIIRALLKRIHHYHHSQAG